MEGAEEDSKQASLLKVAEYMPPPSKHATQNADVWNLQERHEKDASTAHNSTAVSLGTNGATDRNTRDVKYPNKSSAQNAGTVDRIVMMYEMGPLNASCSPGPSQMILDTHDLGKPSTRIRAHPPSHDKLADTQITSVLKQGEGDR